MLATKVWFSFMEIIDRSMHREYNIWHQLDHRPEVLTLPGVIYGERWVSTPDCARASSAPDPLLEHCHYMNMYWFRGPVAESVRDWSDLAERSFQWGRRPDFKLANRLVMGLFATIKGYAAERVLVSPDALPFRPTKGVYVTVSQVLDPHGLSAEEAFGWYDRVRIPDLLACRGAAGAWTFASEAVAFGAPRWDPNGKTESVALRILLIFLDEDPIEFLADVAEHESRWRDERRLRDTSDAERPLFAGPMRTITPWQWDWFDE